MVLLSLSMTSWSGRSSACGWKRNWPRFYGSGLKGEQGYCSGDLLQEHMVNNEVIGDSQHGRGN